MSDDLGYGHLGCYGQDKIQTPNLDRLAEAGIRFTQAYSGCTVCAPARSVLMTGYHTGHTPVRGNSGGIPLRDEDLTLAEILHEAGYRTGLFGKWGLGDAQTEGIPNRQGFDEFFGYLHQKHAHFYYTDYLWHNREKYPLAGNTNGRRTQYTHDAILENGLQFIRDSKDKPFFCFFSFTIPHHEWVVPEESLKIYSGKFPESRSPFRWRQGYAQPVEPKATFAAMVTHMDKGVGQIVALLDQLQITRKTLVLFVSDNGAGDYDLASPEFFKANGPLRGYKGDLYEGGIRVPAIASQPGTIPEGIVSDLVWYFPDLMPTFAEIAGCSDKVPVDCDGLSILPTLKNGETNSQQEHPFLYWESGLNQVSRAVRMGKWKAVWKDPEGDVNYTVWRRISLRGTTWPTVSRRSFVAPEVSWSETTHPHLRKSSLKLQIVDTTSEKG